MLLNKHEEEKNFFLKRGRDSNLMTVGDLSDLRGKRPGPVGMPCHSILTEERRGEEVSINLGTWPREGGGGGEK